MYQVRDDSPSLRDVIQQRNAVFEGHQIKTKKGVAVDAFGAALMIEAVQDMQYEHMEVLLRLARLEAGEEVFPDKTEDRQLLNKYLAVPVFWKDGKMSTSGAAFLKEVFPNAAKNNSTSHATDLQALGGQLVQIQRADRVVTKFPSQQAG